MNSEVEAGASGASLAAPPFEERPCVKPIPLPKAIIQLELFCASEKMSSRLLHRFAVHSTASTLSHPEHLQLHQRPLLQLQYPLLQNQALQWRQLFRAAQTSTLAPGAQFTHLAGY